MTKREIIFEVLEKLNIQSDDTKITEELVGALIDNKRAMLLKQQYAKASWHMPTEIKQELCMSLSLVDKVGGYSCAGKILATTPLPASVKIKGKEGPLLVRKEDGTVIALSVVPVEKLPFLFENRYLQNITYCTVDMDRRLLIISKNDKYRFLKTIRITDIFESPDDVFALTCDKSSGDVWEKPYPVEAAMVPPIVDLIMKDLLKTIQIPRDELNDARDARI